MSTARIVTTIAFHAIVWHSLANISLLFQQVSFLLIKQGSI